MKKILCDRCGRDITNAQDRRYIIAESITRPSEDGKCPPSDFTLVKEVCMGCMLEIEQMFKY